jgi:hypothetical protein
MQTAIVILIIAVAAIYVIRMFRPSKLKSDNPCDSCSGCPGGKVPEFNTRPDAFTERGTCCSQTEDPDECPYAGQSKEVPSNKDLP